MNQENKIIKIHTHKKKKESGQALRYSSSINGKLQNNFSSTVRIQLGKTRSESLGFLHTKQTETLTDMAHWGRQKNREKEKKNRNEDETALSSVL